jgi:ABC-type Fe3+-siderophore transport system permease subunit
MRGWRRWEDWTVVVVGLIMALTPLWSTAMGDSVPMLITAGALLFVVGMINLAGPNLYGIEIGQLLAAGIAIMLPWLGNFAGSNIPAMTAWIGGGIAVIATVLAMKPSVDASHRLARQ